MTASAARETSLLLMLLLQSGLIAENSPRVYQPTFESSGNGQSGPRMVQGRQVVERTIKLAARDQVLKVIIEGDYVNLDKMVFEAVD